MEKINTYNDLEKEETNDLEKEETKDLEKEETKLWHLGPVGLFEHYQEFK